MIPDCFNILEDAVGFLRPSERLPLMVSAVLHKTHIEVDRKGTKAAAATEITMEEVTAAEPEEYVEPVKVYLTRPFLYAIVENKTGFPLFLGCVNSMK